MSDTPGFPLDENVFEHMKNVTGPHGLVAFLNRLEQTVRTKTASISSEVLHLYADGDSGNDANDGLSLAKPKKTLQAVADLVPDIIRSPVVVHLRGTFTLTEHVTFSAFVKAIPRTSTYSIGLVVDGGDEKTDILAETTATGSTVSSLTKAAAGWTLEAYTSYFVEVLDGPAAGDLRLIKKSTADTITVCRDFSADPGAAKFRVFKYATTITDDGNPRTFYSVLHGNSTYDGGFCSIQRVTFTGSSVEVYAQGVVNYCSVSMINISSLRLERGVFTTGYIDVDPETLVVNYYGAFGAGLGVKTVDNSYVGVEIRDCDVLMMQLVISGTIAGGVSCRNCSGILLAAGSRVYGNPVLITGCFDLAIPSIQAIGEFGIGVPAIEGSTGIGLLIQGRSFIRFGKFDVSNCVGHGIEVRGSEIVAEDVITGSGNGGAGVYAHSNSVVTITDGSPPTITGTVGNLAISNPAAEEETWANIDAGTKVTISSEMTMAKEV